LIIVAVELDFSDEVEDKEVPPNFAMFLLKF